MMHGFNWDKWNIGKPTERLPLIAAGQDHLLEQENGKMRWVHVLTHFPAVHQFAAERSGD